MDVNLVEPEVNWFFFSPSIFGQSGLVFGEEF